MYQFFNIFIYIFRRDHARTKLSFTPSVLQKKSEKTASTTLGGDTAALSNDDFRKMLLGSK